MSSIVHVHCDDWAGVYVNGELVAQGHSVYPLEWLEAASRLGITTDQVEADPEWVVDEGGLPKKLANVRPLR